MSTVGELQATPVVLRGTRGGPDVRTLRRGGWAVSKWVTFGVLTTFVGYTTWAAFQNGNFFAGPSLHRSLISPFYSPCITSVCGAQGAGGWLDLHWWSFSPALLILAVPGGFRLTCYYYRKAYYRSFWQSPPACAVADGHARYGGESRFPLVLQNVHRYFWYLALIFNVILTIDAVEAFRLPGAGGYGVSVGTLVLCVNAVLLWMYSLSCHYCRHACGGSVDQFSHHRLRHRLWKITTPLNAKHMQFAWASLIMVGLADLYVRLVASGWISDPKIF